MTRYIDADKIEYEDMLYPRGDGNYEECQIAYRDQIDDIQTADVVEVVRCDQCRHFEAINNDDHGWCKRISDLPVGVSVRYHDDYCSYGERKEE